MSGRFGISCEVTIAPVRWTEQARWTAEVASLAATSTRSGSHRLLISSSPEPNKRVLLKPLKRRDRRRCWKKNVAAGRLFTVAQNHHQTVSVPSTLPVMEGGQPRPPDTPPWKQLRGLRRPGERGPSVGPGGPGAGTHKLHCLVIFITAHHRGTGRLSNRSRD